MLQTLQSRPCRVLLTAAALAVVVLAVHVPAAEAQSKTVWNGVYTEQQATRGAATFASTLKSWNGDALPTTITHQIENSTRIP